MERVPTAKTVRLEEERARLRRVVERRGLCGLANDTKWDELLEVMRTDRDGWRPRYRCKCIDAPPCLSWDGEWFYHPPYPLISLEWLDISFLEKTHRGRLIAPILTDHSAWIGDLMRRIGFDYQKGGTMIRIFGYSPRDMDFFDQNPP